MMLNNYLKIGFRNLWKNKFFSAINTFGLAIGMAVCFFIFLYVKFERSYDRFHKNIDRLYRVPITYLGGANPAQPSAAAHPALGPALKQDFPEVEAFARIAPPNLFMLTTTLSSTSEQGAIRRFNEANFYLTDESFLTMFSFPFVEGRAEGALAQPNSIVLTEAIAKKYFESSRALNKTIFVNGRACTVTGVLKNIPGNSHIKFDFLISLDKGFEYDNWSWPEFHNYILLKPGVNPADLEAKLPAFTKKHTEERLKSLKFSNEFHLQPVKDIHLKSDYRQELEVNGNETTVYFLSLLGVLILIIAWINYINLSTAKSMERAMEVGLRKVSGASRFQLAIQFLFEAFIVNTAAALVSIIIIAAVAPYFDQLTGKPLFSELLNSGLFTRPSFWLIVAGVFILGAIQVGAWPAFIISAFQPIAVLKGRLQQSTKGIIIRKVLVSFQFALSIALIAGSIIVYRQLSFMRTKDLGYNQDQLLVLKAPALADSTLPSKVNYFKTELRKISSVASVASSSEIPGKTILARNGIRRKAEPESKNFYPYLMDIDKEFVSTYKISFAAGSNLPEPEPRNMYETKQTKMLVNEAVVTALGFTSNQEAINQKILLTTWVGEVEGEITGVIKNYHQRSLKEKIDPIVYYHSGVNRWSYFTVKLHASDLSNTREYIEKVYDRAFAGNAFEAFFLDDYFNRQYEADRRFGNIFSLFTILAIFIACLGLIGLSTYAIKVRIKEIGIRKVLGASVSGIVFLLSKEFVKLVAIASVVAIPIIYLMAERWTENFAFHIQLGWIVFAAAPLLLLILALLTVSVQSIRAALANPVKSLRNDG
jgi:putative ABC transport system permease protein